MYGDLKLRYRLEALICHVRGPEAEIQTGGTNMPCTGELKLRYRQEALMCRVWRPEAEIQTGGTNMPCTGT